MSWWKQLALIVVVAVAAAAVWARLDDGAPARLEAVGLPSGLVRVVAGTPSADALVTGASEKPGAKADGQAAPKARPAPVIVSTVAEGRINDRLTAIGDGAAVRSVSVTPLSAGVLTEVMVRSGDRVTAGRPLARLDSRAEEIVLDQSELALATAQDKFDRIEALVKSRTATAVQLADARNERDSADLALRDARLKLDQRTIAAPIDGVVGIIATAAGNAVTTQSEIATIDDRSSILVDFWVPERFAATIAPGQPVKAHALALPGEDFDGIVDAVASRIERDSRTLRVRAVLGNEGDRLRPGMAFEIEMHFQGTTFPAVDPLAVQWSSNGAFVWTVVDGQATRVTIRVIQRNSDRVLIEGGLKPGDTVITEGVQSLRDGMPVLVVPTETVPGAS
jgi:RND family efflux transporter MFP subunit